MVDLVRSGRSPEALSREFEPTAQAIWNWVRQADRDEGRRQDGATSAEREELTRLRRENRRLRHVRELLRHTGMRAAGTPPLHIAGRGQDGGLQLHRGVVQSRPPPFWHPLSIPNGLRDADAQGNPNDLSDKPVHRTGSTPTLERTLAQESG